MNAKLRAAGQTIAKLIRLGAGALARGILTGGNEARKGVGPATQAILRKFGRELKNVRYEDARNVVRRVQRQIAAAAKIESSPSTPVSKRRLPVLAELEYRPEIRYQYQTVIEFSSPAGRRSYRTMTVINSNVPLSANELRSLAETQVRADRGYEPKRGENKRTNKSLSGWEVTDFAVITAGRNK